MVLNLPIDTQKALSSFSQSSSHLLSGRRENTPDGRVRHISGKEEEPPATVNLESHPVFFSFS
jgi:hypothetical protein